MATKTQLARKKAQQKREAFQQYSKKMCTRVTIFWVIYRIAISLLIFFKPEISTAIIKLTEGVDTVMIINMSVYTANSTVEKVSLAYFGKKFKDTLEETEEDTTELEKAFGESIEAEIQNG